MDEIQKVLIKADRKDLAQEYYKKFAKKIEKESQGGYIEIMEMDPNWEAFAKGIITLEKIWQRWKNGPDTKKSDINPAKKELMKFVNDRLLRKLR